MIEDASFSGPIKTGEIFATSEEHFPIFPRFPCKRSLDQSNPRRVCILQLNQLIFSIRSLPGGRGERSGNEINSRLLFFRA